MDKNKLAELKRIGYTIPKTCDLCKHGSFVGDTVFGACTIRTYEHLKHTGAPRQLSVYRGGTCSSFEASDTAVNILGPWYEFLK